MIYKVTKNTYDNTYDNTVSQKWITEELPLLKRLKEVLFSALLGFFFYWA